VGWGFLMGRISVLSLCSLAFKKNKKKQQNPLPRLQYCRGGAGKKYKNN